MELTKIISGFLLCLIMISSVIAQLTPLAINGKIFSDGNVEGLNVLIENTRSGKSLVVQTEVNPNDGAGEYLADASEFGGAYGGDTFRITITHCAGEARCVKTIQWTGQAELFLTFDLTGISGPEIEYVCWDDSIVSDPVDCPDHPEPEIVIEDENKATSSNDGKYASVDVYYGQVIDICLDNAKVSGLKEGEIYFDGKNYEFKEDVCFNGVIKTSIDDEDFGTKPYLTTEEWGTEYNYIFKEFIDISQIDEDEILEIEVLGEKFKIISASANEITVRYGEEHFLKEGGSITVEGHIITLLTVTESNVLISVDGVQEIVYLGSSKEINKVRVLVEDILYKGYDGADNFAEILVGEETDKTIKDGDYLTVFVASEDEELWQWEINLGDTPQSIGVKNVEEFMGIDEDDDYKAIGVGQSLFLPNDYMEIRFKSVTSPEMNDLNFKIKDEYLYIRGNKDNTFTYGTGDYDRIYVDNTGIYDDDDVLITTDKLEIGDSGIYLEMGSVKILDLIIELDLSDIIYKAISYVNKDAVYMDYFGIIFKDPEQAIDDKEGLEVSVPEDRPEAIVAFGEIRTEIPSGLVDPIKVNQTECKETTCQVCPDDSGECQVTTCETCRSCPEEKICAEVPKGGFNWRDFGVGIVIMMLAGIVAYFGGGVKLYKNRAGSVTIQHRHKLIRGYHDANIKHTNPDCSHRRWKEDPLGCLTDVKKIEEQGSLNA